MVWLPVQRHWRLNERHYGALQGWTRRQRRTCMVPSKRICGGAATTSRHRRSAPTVQNTPATIRRYRLLAPALLPASECLHDVVLRVLPYFYDVIVPQLQAGLNVLITAHGNSLRALVMQLEGISRQDIAELNIPTGVPRQIPFDDAMRVTSCDYLGDADAIAAAASAVAKQAGA